MFAALFISLKVLAFAVPLLVVFGGGIGWLLAKRSFRGRDALSLVLQLPVVLPPSVLGFYLLFGLAKCPFLRDSHILFAFPAAVLGALVPSLPIMIQAARAGFSGVDPQLEDAARTLGRTEFQVFSRITLPLARRTLLVGLALASARALGDFGVTLMVAGNIPLRTQTLPLYIYCRVESLDFLGAHVAAALLTAVGLGSLYLVHRMEGASHERLA